MSRTARSIRLPDDLWAELITLAAEQKRSVNNLVEVILAMAADPDVPEPLLGEIARRS